MGSRGYICLTVIAAWLIVTGMAAARADTVSCTCTDACGCPDDDTSDTTQPTWCNGTTLKTCTCAGFSCPTGNGQTCVAVTVCGGQAGPYAPCGGSSTDYCSCPGQECQNGSGQTCEAKIRCNVAPDPYKPCGGSTSKNCVCQGDGCPTDAGKTCEQKDLCNARTGDYTPCGGKGDCPCGGEYCTDSNGPAPGADSACNQQCNSATQTACGSAKQPDGTWNNNGKKQCSQNGCTGSTCDCGYYHCKNSTAGPPDVKPYPCACWDCSFDTCGCGTPGSCDFPGCVCNCSDFGSCACFTAGQCGRSECT